MDLISKLLSVTGVRMVVTAVIISMAVVLAQPTGAGATGILDIFPGPHRIFPFGVHNSLPIYEVQPREPSEQEVLTWACRKRGYGEDCAKALLGMMWKESLNDSTAVGDRGRARGYFQIHYRLHGVTIDCAEDLACSANWTLDYMERNGYPRYAYYAVQCHNGCNAGNGYAASVLRHGNRLWGKPLPKVNVVAAK